MTSYDFDLIVIGAGPGGYVAALKASESGLKVACIEKEFLGGTCLNVGCIPSKALLHSSETFDKIKNLSKKEGIHCHEVSFVLSEMMEKKDLIISSLREGIKASFKKLAIEHITGTASFIDPHTLAIGNRKITSKNILIATGSKPIELPFLPFDEKNIVSSTGALKLTDVPKKMVVIGAGVIGIEIASVYARLGSQVTFVEMEEKIAPGIDEFLSQQLLQRLKKQGMEFLLKSRLKSGQKTAEGIALFVESPDKTISLLADVVLVGVGRSPNTTDLNLKDIRVATDSKGFILVDGFFRTNQPHIYAIGDVIEGPMLAHKASYEALAVIQIILGLKGFVNYMTIPNVVYTNPEVASLGFSEKQAEEAGLEVVVGISHFKANGRARCSDEMDGFVKVIGDKVSHRLIGMHIVGHNASELISEGVLALGLKATIKDMATSCYAHPTLSETIVEACRACMNN